MKGISIIICSRTQKIQPIFKQNIISTVGVVYELIIINNHENKYSIFEAYNLGIQKSKYEYLCFIHDDILFHTSNWGAIIISILSSNPSFGLIGIAGSSVKSKTPCGWWDCEDKYKSINIIQHYGNNEVKTEQLGFVNDSLEEVVVIDGVFLVLRKTANISFNSNLQGFHNYDFNIAIETLKSGFKIGVTNQILIEHFSIGNLDVKWLKSTIKVHKKYNQFLPLSVNTIITKDFEIFSCKRFISHCLLAGKKSLALKYCFKLYCLSYFSKTSFITFLKTLKNIIRA